MRGIVVKIYLGCLVFCSLLLIHTFLHFQREGMEQQLMEGYETPQDYSYNVYQNSSAPVGICEEYVFHFDRVEGSYRELIFYTIHQNARVYVDGERVYRMQAYGHNDFGKSPGCVWNSVVLDDEDAGREIRVRIYPVYKSSVGVTPKFYFGERYAISMKVILTQLPTLLLSIIAIFAGLIFVAYALYNFRSMDTARSLSLLGLFSVIIGLWKLTDNMAVYLLFPEIAAMYLAPYLMLHLASVPFVLFVKELGSEPDRKIWYVPVFTSFIGLGVTLVLQILDIYDMRQMLWVIHVELITAAAVIIGMLIHEIRTRGMNEKIRRNLFFLMVCLVGVVVDIIVYYLSRGMSVNMLGMLGVIVYIFALGAYSVKDTRELIRFGMQAQTFERKAYHDQLTGLYNRMAYVDYTGREEFTPEHCILAVFDLNNLKKCNDTLGHEKGDLYIRECARIIQDCFGDAGRCYRMGGDEFTVLLENISMDNCKKRIKRMQEAVAECNRRHPEIDMGIAGGMEVYDKRIDYDIGDTYRRADKKMYREKFAMKQAKAGDGTGSGAGLEV